MLTVRIQEKNHSESIMVLKLKDGNISRNLHFPFNEYPLRFHFASKVETALAAVRLLRLFCFLTFIFPQLYKMRFLSSIDNNSCFHLIAFLCIFCYDT